jgi:hypothetical protein
MGFAIEARTGIKIGARIAVPTPIARPVRILPFNPLLNIAI